MQNFFSSKFIKLTEFDYENSPLRKALFLTYEGDGITVFRLTYKDSIYYEMKRTLNISESCSLNSDFMHLSTDVIVEVPHRLEI